MTIYTHVDRLQREEHHCELNFV